MTAINTASLRSIFSLSEAPELMQMCADGETRLKTLSVLAREIEALNPTALVRIDSRAKGHIWHGFVNDMLSDLVDRFLSSCVHEISVDDSGVTLIVR